MRIDPEADDFLKANGLGGVRADTVKEQNGRNNNFLVVTDRDRAVFVKRIAQRSESDKERFRACVSFAALDHDTEENEALATVPLLAAEEETGFLAYEAVHRAKSLAEAVPEADESEVLNWAAECGRLLAIVHRMDPATVPERSSEPPLPPVDWLTALPFGVYAQASAPALEVWHKLQNDPAVREALVRLRRDEREASACPIHGDLRLDQVLVEPNGALRLIDLEEFRVGDSARDVGAMAGEWLHRATLELVKPEVVGTTVVEPELTHDEVLRRGARSLERWRPALEKFWQSYRAHGGGSDDREYVVRVTRFAGWHLYDRLVAGTEMTSRLSALQWAAAGIGRQALLNPEAAAPALGLPTVESPEENVA